MYSMDDTPGPLTGGLLCLAMIAVFLITIPVSAALERRRLRRVTARFLQGRAALPDAAFLLRAGVAPAEEAFFLAARRSMATLCGVAPDMIYPEDTWRSLMDLQWDNGFVEDVVFGLERELRKPLPLVFLYDVHLSFVEYVRKLAAGLHRAESASDEPVYRGWP
jgi:hypothetical protein